MVRKNRCCIATVQIDDLPSDLKSANSLFRMMVQALAAPGMPLASVDGVEVAGRRRIRAHKIESSANVTGASSLFASFKRGRRGQRHLALQKGTSKVLRHQTRDPGERIVAPGDAQTGERTRYWLWLDNTITGLWVALLLAIIAYTLVDGEGVLAQFDGLDLVAAYSLSP